MSTTFQSISTTVTAVVEVPNTSSTSSSLSSEILSSFLSTTATATPTLMTTTSSKPTQLLPSSSPSTSASASPTGLGTGAKVGIALGCAVTFIILFVLLTALALKKRQHHTHRSLVPVYQGKPDNEVYFNSTSRTVVGSRGEGEVGYNSIEREPHPMADYQNAIPPAFFIGSFSPIIREEEIAAHEMDGGRQR